MRKNYAGIDYFRLAAALMVVGIHIGPFSSWSKDADYLLTYCLGRIAVPFFLMTTGYFVLAPYVSSGFQKKRLVHRYFVKNITLYLAATILYVPLALYSENIPHSILEFFKYILFDGTFYHLWYFPAAIIGCILLIFLIQKSMRIAIIFSVAAYIVGMFGDSYYGVVERNRLFRWIHDGIFSVSSYTRNGIFFAPVFILLGMLLSFSEVRCSVSKYKMGLLISFVCMFVEGFITYSLNLQKHNSMYLFLLPVMYFLFQILLAIPGKALGWIRNEAMLLYILHPAVIVILRGIAKVLGFTKLLIENTMIQYLSVCMLSLFFVLIIQLCMEGMKRYVSKGTGMD